MTPTFKPTKPSEIIETSIVFKSFHGNIVYERDNKFYLKTLKETLPAPNASQLNGYNEEYGHIEIPYEKYFHYKDGIIIWSSDKTIQVLKYDKDTRSLTQTIRVATRHKSFDVFALKHHILLKYHINCNAEHMTNNGLRLCMFPFNLKNPFANHRFGHVIETCILDNSIILFQVSWRYRTTISTINNITRRKISKYCISDNYKYIAINDVLGHASIYDIKTTECLFQLVIDIDSDIFLHGDKPRLVTHRHDILKYYKFIYDKSLLLILCARSFDADSFFHQDFLPLDMLKVILNFAELVN